MDLQASYKIIQKNVSEEDIRQEMAYQAANLYTTIVEYKRNRIFVPGFSYLYGCEDDPILDCECALSYMLACGEMNGVRPAVVKTEQNGEDVACFNAAELLAALHGPECAVTKQSVLMGRLLNWGKERGMTEKEIHRFKEFYANDWADSILAKR